MTDLQQLARETALIYYDTCEEDEDVSSLIFHILTALRKAVEPRDRHIEAIGVTLLKAQEEWKQQLAARDDLLRDMIDSWAGDYGIGGSKSPSQLIARYNALMKEGK